MNVVKKYIVGAVSIATIASSLLFLASAHAQDKKPILTQPSQPSTIVNINPKGEVLLRGTVKTAGTTSLVVKSWGGDWIVNISSNARSIPENSFDKIKAGDFVMIKGSIDAHGSFTVDAERVHDWTLAMQGQENKKESEEIRNSSRIFVGTVDTMNVAANSITIKTEAGVTYTVNLSSSTKVLNENFVNISLGDIKVGDKVRVFGTLSGSTINALIVRDVSIEGKK